jgi:hypothetical protein
MRQKKHAVIKRTGFFLMFFLFFAAMQVNASGGAPAWNVPEGADKGTVVLLVSDIHFDPFADGAAKELEKTDIGSWRAILEALDKGKFPDYGDDTNFSLLESSLKEIGKTAGGADCAIVCGDMICHRFEAKYRLHCSLTGSGSGFALKTIEFLSLMIKQSLPGVPVYYVVGNNDSDNGDYNIRPSGEMLSALSSAYETISSDRRAKADFARGGYYELPFPGIDKGELIVLNDVYWHRGYKRSRRIKEQPGDIEIKWLKQELDAASAKGKKALIAMHIPPGIDSYLAAKDKACKGPDGFLLPGYNDEFLALMASHGAVVENIFSGHTHFDDFRVFSNEAGPFLTVSIIPSISPVHGNNPAFEMAMLKKNGEIADKAVYSLAGYGVSGASPAWGLEYMFCGAYGVGDMGPASMASLAESIGEKEAARDSYFSFYTAGNTLLSMLLVKQSAAYGCALTGENFSEYAECGCGVK